MAKFDGFLLCSDIDGTLTDGEGGISDGNCEAIKYFQDNGGLFTIATGRLAGYVEIFTNRFKPNTHTICANGAVLYDDTSSKMIVSYPLRHSDNEMMVEMAERYPKIGKIVIDANIQTLVFTADDLRNNPNFIFEYPDYNPAAEWMKVSFIQDESDTAELVAEMNREYGDRYNYDRSWPGGFEMYAHNAGKGIMMNLLRECAGKPIHTTIAVGDYENDIMMLRAADIGYAVENALPSVKEAADRITVHHRDDAIAQIISEL